MATKAHDCSIKKNNTICPECGRSAPDWCGKDEPAKAPVALIPTGADLQETQIEAEAAAKEIARLVEEQNDAVEKVFKTKNKKTPGDVI